MLYKGEIPAEILKKMERGDDSSSVSEEFDENDAAVWLKGKEENKEEEKADDDIKNLAAILHGDKQS